MKIIKKDLKKGSIVIQITSLEDMWYLANVLDQHDVVTAKTTRKVKLGNGEQRKATVKKVHVTITVDVEKVEFHKFTNNLRIAGKIVAAPQDIPHGSFHTLSIEEGTVVTIEKQQWLKFQVDKLEEAAKESFPKVLICVLDRKEVSFALLKRYGFEMLTEFEGIVEEKAFKVKVAEDGFYNEVVKMIQDYVVRHKIEHVVIASPAFWKEELMKVLKKKAPAVASKVTQATCNHTGQTGVVEVLKRTEVKQLLRDVRALKEVTLVDEIFKEIAQQGSVTYGLKEVKHAAGLGAVKALVITDELMLHLRQQEQYEQLEVIMRAVDSAGGDVCIITTENEAGERLQGLGGIAALLRYKIE